MRINRLRRALFFPTFFQDFSKPDGMAYEARYEGTMQVGRSKWALM